MLKPRLIRRRVAGIVMLIAMLAGFAAAQNIRARDRALYEAAGQGELSAIDNLLSAGANVNSVVLGDDTPLLAAARRGRLETVIALLERGADPNIPAPGDRTALIVAAGRGRFDIVRTLLDRADLNNDGQTWRL